MIKRMLMFLGMMTLVLGVGLVALAYNEYHRVDDPVQRAEVPCELDKYGSKVIVTVETTGMAHTKENLDLLTKKVCGTVVEKIK